MQAQAADGPRLAEARGQPVAQSSWRREEACPREPADRSLSQLACRAQAVSTFSRDHVRFMGELLHYLGAYAGPRALAPTTIESIMVTMNSVNTCPYCSGLHDELARMAQARK